MPIYKGHTSRGVHIRALYAALTELLSLRLAAPPRAGGETPLRDHIAALVRAYPHELTVNDVELAQLLAEEDGNPHEDTI